MEFRPCIDLHDGKVKQIVGSSLTDNNQGLVENFISDKGSDFYASMFKSDGLTGGHVIMLGPGNKDAAVKALNAYPGGLQVGGGITTENADFYLENGASHVIVTSYVFKDGEINMVNLEKLVSKIGKEKLVLDLSCRAKDGTYYVVTDRWQKFSTYEVNKDNLLYLSKYCDEFLVHAVDVEGHCNGIQTDLVKKLGDWTPIGTTYAGGVKSFKDIDLVRDFGNGKLNFTIGSALDIFGGELSYKDVVKCIRK